MHNTSQSPPPPFLPSSFRHLSSALSGLRIRERSHFLLNPDQTMSRPSETILPWDQLSNSGRGSRGKKSHFRLCHLDWLVAFLLLRSLAQFACGMRSCRKTKLSHFPPFFVITLPDSRHYRKKRCWWVVANVPIGPPATYL